MTGYVDDAKNLLEEHKNITCGRWYVHVSGGEIQLSNRGFYAPPKEATEYDILAMSDVPCMLHLIEELVKELEACHEKIETMEEQKCRDITTMTQ